MKKDQILLYIGEGGCTANDGFFESIEKKNPKIDT